jgi:hypothetical protein
MPANPIRAHGALLQGDFYVKRTGMNHVRYLW